ISIESKLFADPRVFSTALTRSRVLYRSSPDRVTGSHALPCLRAAARTARLTPMPTSHPISDRGPTVWVRVIIQRRVFFRSTTSTATAHSARDLRFSKTHPARQTFPGDIRRPSFTIRPILRAHLLILTRIARNTG